MSLLASAPAKSTSAPATRVRFGVLAFACTLSMITYLDRVAIASAAGNIVKDLGLQSVADLKWAFTAFAFAYALFEVPTGWLGDMFGPRRSLTRIVLWWSFFTVLTAAVGLHLGPVVLGLGFLVCVRFLFGIGEAGAYPNITRALHNWLPLHERGRGQGLVWFSGKLMGGLTPFLWTVLVVGTSANPALFGWRGGFCLFGAIGILWCILFTRWFRNRPEEKPGVNAAELDLIRSGTGEPSEFPEKPIAEIDLIGGDEKKGQGAHKVPWKNIVTNGNFLALCLMYATQAYGWYFNITYLPQFLERQYHLPNTSMLGALYKGGPLWMGAIGCLLGGVITDAVIRRTGNRRFGRRVCGWIGHSMCVVCFLICPIAPNVFVFFAAVSLAAFFTDLTVASAWATCQDIGGRYAAIVGAFMNMGAGLCGALAGWVTGSILESSIAASAAKLGVQAASLSIEQTNAALLHGYHLNFYSFAALYLVAFLCWFKIDSTRSIDAT
jgi:ACS family glucarate transporter-like MFS transporter